MKIIITVSSVYMQPAAIQKQHYLLSYLGEVIGKACNVACGIHMNDMRDNVRHIMPLHYRDRLAVANVGVNRGLRWVYKTSRSFDNCI